jgi:hypothetical protein
MGVNWNLIICFANTIQSNLGKYTKIKDYGRTKTRAP